MGRRDLNAMLYWINVYRANLKTAIAARGGSITNGTGSTFARGDFTAYFLVFMIFGHLTMSWDAFEFAYRVRDGNLSPRLLKPLHPIHTDVANNVAFKLTTSAML